MKGLNFLILFFILLTSCKDKNLPNDLIEEQKMIQIMSELHTIDGYISSLSFSDSTRTNGINFYNTVYKNNRVTKAQYERSLKYYSMDPVKLDSMYSDVVKILTDKEKILNKKLMKSPEIQQ